MGDSPIPLVSAGQFTSGPYGDLVRDYSDQALSDLLSEGTRMCETETGRRLAPFTTTESQRASGMDPDEYTDSANLPMDLAGTLGRSYAQALGATTLVRHAWVNEYATRYPEMWSYSNLQVTVIRSYGGSEVLTPAQIVGAENDSGHIWFQLGLFIPIGSLLRMQYSGGYQTFPADLVRAGRFMSAYLACRDLDPRSTQHDPDQLYAAALKALAGYGRD